MYSEKEKERESKRQLECPCRRYMTCGMLDVALGWKHICPMDVCDRCWNNGGPTTLESRRIRDSYQQTVLNAYADLTILGKQSTAVVETCLRLHMEPEQAIEARKHPAIQAALNRKDKGCSGCRRKKK